MLLLIKIWRLKQWKKLLNSTQKALMICHTYHQQAKFKPMDSSTKATKEKILSISRLISNHKIVIKIARTIHCLLSLIKILVAMLMVKILTLVLMISIYKKKDWKTQRSLMMMKIWTKFKETKLNSNTSRCNMNMVPRWNRQLRPQVPVLWQVKLKIMT